MVYAKEYREGRVWILRDSSASDDLAEGSPP
jgi:hypothetical protein